MHTPLQKYFLCIITDILSLSEQQDIGTVSHLLKKHIFSKNLETTKLLMSIFIKMSECYKDFTYKNVRKFLQNAKENVAQLE